ncbi:histidine phosphatase family protein [Enemella evansiae]|uniref:histidine phosphatase family protein n=1 Tax=Enemella evansiae TaxID=2016499 RepID=UPI000B969191|nr:histidine phosphatase family protein [Enemella evansiae]OYN99680.1 phosphoglycerate mutase [Enemella evansiae]TDO92678.1 2,3-bisphosphoglycerate-dependent phosphoglycerate mutase [Enemella evansiae]
MTTLFLVRHGRSTANTAGVLAGRAEGVELDDIGREQARATAARLAGVPLAAAVSSPITRCVQTAELLLAGREPAPELIPQLEPGLTECDYGEWTGHKLSELAGNELWKTVQRHPSAAVFPGGEALTQMYARAVESVRGWDRRIATEHGEKAAWLAVSHGDVIKSILADALGLHLDSFQRIMVDPASVSVIRYTASRPYVVTMNSTAGELAPLVPAEDDDNNTDAAVGGGLGARASTPETGE